MAKGKDTEEYEFEKHQFVQSKTMGKQVCVKCGLVSLNNPFTDWAVQKGCNASLHPSFQSARMKYTRKFDF